MTDKSAAAIREFAEKIVPVILNSGLLCNTEEIIEAFTGDLTALISEHYVSREECKELLQQRDELKEALLVAIKVLLPYQDLYNAVAERNAIKLAEAAIKNTEKK